MKINGKQINEVCVEQVIIPRQSGDIVFKCRAVLDYDVFDKLLPEPEPPVIAYPDGRKGKDPTDLDYQKARTDYNFKRYKWMIIESLKATEGLEFEQIKDNDPETWGNLEKELRDSGFSVPEVVRIIQGVQAANGMSEAKIKEAEERFSKQVAQKGQNT